MKTEEQIAATKRFAGEAKASMKRRDDHNDYHGRRMYMITMEVEGRRPLFGRVAGNPYAEAGSAGAAHMELSPLGEAVQAEWQGIPRYYPQIEIMAVQIMPDHLHGILFVHEQLPVHLGQVMAGFKKGCERKWKAIRDAAAAAAAGTGTATIAAVQPQPTLNSHTASSPASAAAEQFSSPAAASAEQVPSATAASAEQVPSAAAASAERVPSATAASAEQVPSAAAASAERVSSAAAASAERVPSAAAAVTAQAAVLPQPSPSTPQPSPTVPPSAPRLFALGYNDLLLKNHDEFQTWKRYLADNPRRLLLKRARPDLLRVRLDVDVCGRTCSAVGNLALLSAPQKLRVRISRSIAPQLLEQEKARLLAAARAGAVLVSPAISPGEKAVTRAAFDEGLPLIVLMDNGLAPMQKPSGERFRACAEGRLLLLSPFPHRNHRVTITRQVCEVLNALAWEISGGR